MRPQRASTHAHCSASRCTRAAADARDQPGTDSANTPLLNASFGAKLGLAHWQDVLFKQWWSDTAQGTGAATIKVFKGTHTVAASMGGRTATAEALVGNGAPTTVTIQL